MTKISIIVLTYNHAVFIEENIRGILMQKVACAIELIICDDCSTDDTVAVIKQVTRQAPPNIKMKIFAHSSNLGATPNFYFALEQVTGDYIAFCEGDDYWTDPLKLQTQLDFMQHRPDCSLCFHTAVNISDNPTIHGTSFSKVEDRIYTAEEIYKHWTIHTATVMMRAEVLQSDAKKKTMTRPDLQYFDTILFLAASTVGELYGISKAMSAYRRHDGGLSAGAVNYSRDLRHNKLDKIIGRYYGGNLKKISDWLIFSRSRTNFSNLWSKTMWGQALKFLPWLLRNRLIIYVFHTKKS